MPRAILLAFAQLDDPAFRAPILWGVLGAVVALLGLAGLAALGLGWALEGWPGWLTAIIQFAGGAATLLLAWWLFLPIAVMIASGCAGPVVTAVERRHYPHVVPAGGAPLLHQAWWGVVFGLQMLALQILLLPLVLFVPLLGAVLAFIISAYAMGVGFFEATAQARMGVVEARAARRARRWQVWLLGAALAALAAVPILNLLIAVIGVAASVHLLHGGRRALQDRR
ncbi:EI24 domain-containing protein [Plastoroseomonas arctica]|uniref:Cysteine biosynthesis protein CysZ n=1 Tax=Plastoroseomonas arctica TaxID=1509237 RepID=A0AAF1KNA3_9PROT|nr:EI24 domain-containing protein [Plastoroseomonas arctica]MBR0656339.1 cysteine biosynthesis protein CysZ [Plastoroseomonas arctica]